MKIQTLRVNHWGRGGKATEALLQWDQYYGLRDRGYGSCLSLLDCKSRVAARGTDGSTTSLVLLISDQLLACFANHLIFKTEKITQGWHLWISFWSNKDALASAIKWQEPGSEIPEEACCGHSHVLWKHFNSRDEREKWALLGPKTAWEGDLKKKGWLECSETPISVAQQSQLLLLLLLPVLVKFAFPQNVKMRKNAVPQLDVDLTPSGQCVKSESLQEQKTDLQRTWK